MFKKIMLIAAVTFLLCAAANAVVYRGNPQLCREIANEGSVLLENKNSALPLAQSDTAAIFGQAQIDFAKGGTGSSNVQCNPYSINFLEGMRSHKIKIYEPLASAYEADKSLTLTQNMINDAAKAANTAIIVIGRTSGEDLDRNVVKGDWFLSDGEDNMMKLITSAGFKKVVVILNVPSPMDTSWAEKYNIDAVLLTGFGGMECGNSAADIVCGDANPSGKLTDTWAKTYEDYPSSSNYNQFKDHVNYEENIYVGYRYFSTFDPQYTKVRYPFGYGLSYTTFSVSNEKESVSNKIITLSADIKNTGTVAGKEVLQSYYSAPQGKLGKPAMALAGFVKTKLLAPGESETVKISFPASAMASYDDTGKTGRKSCYVLESGEYKIYLGTSVADASKAKPIKVYKVKKLTVCQKLSEQLTPSKLPRILLSDGSYEVPSSYIPEKGTETVIKNDSITKIEAEDFVKCSDGIAPEWYTSINNMPGKCIAYMDRKDMELEYKFNVKTAGKYAFRLTASNGYGSIDDAFSIFVNGIDQNVKVASPLVKLYAWHTFQDLEPAEITLPAGSVTLKIVSKGAFGNSDYFLIAPEEKSAQLFASFDGKATQEQQVMNKDLGVKERTDYNGGKIMFADVVSNPNLLDAFVGQLSDEDMAYLAGGHPNLNRGCAGAVGGLEYFGIPTYQTFDGPLGVSIAINTKTTAWPSGTLVASTWNPALAEKMGEGTAKEAKLAGVHIWLAPGVNIHRDPLCGRNFEYQSEDPFLSGKVAAALIIGSEGQGVPMTIKHFAGNEKEGSRSASDSHISERALREIYMKSFEIAIKDSHVSCLMTGCNLLNGMEVAERGDLLTNILRDEWGFDGVVMTDWDSGANVQQILAGNNIEMPAGREADVMAAVRNGKLPREKLVENTKDIIRLFIKISSNM